LLFAIWTLLLFPKVAQGFVQSHSRFFFIVIASLITGFSIEYIQTSIGRDFSLRDLGFDFIGTLIALCGLIARGTLTIHKALSRFTAVLTFLLCIYAFAPLGIVLIDETNMYRRFPMLADFENRLESDRWRGPIEVVKLLSSTGESKVLKINLGTEHFSGASLHYFSKDWRGYRQLVFELFNPEPRPLQLTIRIHDAKHYDLGRGDYYDRFNQPVDLKPGWNTISLKLSDVASAPVKRAMDLGNIQAFGFFNVDLPRPRTVYIDRLRLEM
jgi:hypothetical protein